MSHYLLTATDKAGAMDRRIACRDEHIAYIDKLRDQDKALLGAAQLDDDGKMSGSVIFFDMTKEEFIKLMGENNMIKFGSLPELFYILEETKPYIVHMLTDIDMETNLANSIRGKAKHFIEKNIDGTPEDSLSFYRRIGA